MSVSVAIKNGAYTTGEGPYWEEASQRLLYVDIVCGEVHRWTPATNNLETLKFDDTLSFIVPRSAGGYMIGLGRTISHLDWDTQKVEKWAEAELSGSKNRFNDAKCDATGRLWAGTMGHEPVPAQPELQKGALFSFDINRQFRQHVDKINISNGLAWSHDNNIMYYIDSYPRCVYAFDYDITNGNICNRRTAMDFNTETVEHLGYPDGMCIDTDGKLWVACYKAGKVVQFDPVTGKEIQAIKFPVERITSCCFGGPEYRLMYVTSGKFGLTEDEFNNEQPLAGSVFAVTGLNAKGSAAPQFAG